MPFLAIERGKGSSNLGVRENVVVIMAEAARATNELAKDDVAEGVPAPAVGVSSPDLLGLLPALLLHAVGEASRVRVRVRVLGDLEVFEVS